MPTGCVFLGISTLNIILKQIKNAMDRIRARNFMAFLVGKFYVIKMMFM
jgi:hypothetical protein